MKTTIKAIRRPNDRFIEDPFYMINVTPAIRYAPLTAMTKLVLIELSGMERDETHSCYVSDNYLMRMLNLQPLQINNAYKQLTEKRFLQFQKVLIDGKIYRQVTFPQPVDSSEQFKPVVIIEED